MIAPRLAPHRPDTHAHPHLAAVSRPSTRTLRNAMSRRSRKHGAATYGGVTSARIPTFTMQNVVTVPISRQLPPLGHVTRRPGTHTESARTPARTPRTAAEPAPVVPRAQHAQVGSLPGRGRVQVAQAAPARSSYPASVRPPCPAPARGTGLRGSGPSQGSKQKMYLMPAGRAARPTPGPDPQPGPHPRRPKQKPRVHRVQAIAVSGPSSRIRAHANGSASGLARPEAPGIQDQLTTVPSARPR